MNKIQLLLLALTATLLVACEKSEQDYRYVITNKTSEEHPILIQYNVEGIKDDLEKELFPGDSVVIAERSDIRGKKVWDIETSISLYKVKHLKAFSSDESHITEELAYRKLWHGPADIEDVGFYQIDLTDSLFVLTKQENYTYCIKNELRDTVFSTSHLKLLSGENTTRSADTILRGETQSIGAVDIYSYGEEMAGEKKYKTQKMSGLSSILFFHKNNRYIINLSKDTAYFVISQDTCTLVISDNMEFIK